MCLYQALRTLITKAALIAGLDARPDQLPDRARRRHRLRRLLADIRRWIIRHRPDRKAPIKTVRPHLRYTTRSATDPEPAWSPVPSNSNYGNPEFLNVACRRESACQM